MTNAAAATHRMPAAEEVLVAASDWTPHGSARVVTDHLNREREGIRWIEIRNDAEARQVHGVLCDLLSHDFELELIENLLQPDEQPEIDPPGPAVVRRASAFDVRAFRSTESTKAGDGESPSGSGLLTFRMVEFISGPDWLVTCWHDPVTYRGADRVEGEFPPPQDRRSIWDAVARRWHGNGVSTSGDLGVLVLDELVLSYASARREVTSWLEEWELTLYRGEPHHIDQRTLEDLWGSVARFRSWLAPLNPPGIKADLAKAWFVDVRCGDQVLEVDRRIDNTLEKLAEAAHALRASFALVHEERQRRRSTRVERIAVIALVPTFIASFFGANTKLPGGGTWAGFDEMIAAMIVCTILALFLLRVLQGDRGHDRRR